MVLHNNELMEENGELECLLCGATFHYGLDHNCGNEDNVHLETEPIYQEASNIQENSDKQLICGNKLINSSVHIYESTYGVTFPSSVDYHCGKDDNSHLVFQPISQEAFDNSNVTFIRDNQQLASSFHFNEPMTGANFPYGVDHNCGKDMCDNVHLMPEPISQEASDNTGDQLIRNNQPLTCSTDSVTGLSGVSSLHTRKNIPCSSCERECKDNYNPQEHFRVHPIEKLFGYEEYSARLCTRSNLNMHHPFVCEGCGTRFLLRSHLQQHIRFHKGIMPFVCRECGVGFSLLCALHTHRLSRNNIGIPCNYSEKRCELELNFPRHKKIHAVSRPTFVSLNNVYPVAGPSIKNVEDQLHQEVRHPVRRKGIGRRDNFFLHY